MYGRVLVEDGGDVESVIGVSCREGHRGVALGVKVDHQGPDPTGECRRGQSEGH